METKELLSLGNCGGYYGHSSCFSIDNEDGELHYWFTPSGWTYDTYSQLEAAALLSDSEYLKEESLKKFKTESFDKEDIKKALYWITGGNSRWMFHEENPQCKSFEELEDEIVDEYSNLLEDIVRRSETLFDLANNINLESCFFDVTEDLYEHFIDWSDELYMNTERIYKAIKQLVYHYDCNIIDEQTLICNIRNVDFIQHDADKPKADVLIKVVADDIEKYSTLEGYEKNELVCDMDEFMELLEGKIDKVYTSKGNYVTLVA